MSYDDGIELEPIFAYGNGATVCEGNEVYVRGIGNRLLGVGIFAGGLVLLESEGTGVVYPIIEVQGRLIAGGEVDLWSSDVRLIEEHRLAPTYPVEDYINEIRSCRGKMQNLVDIALSAQMGIALE